MSVGKLLEENRRSWDQRVAIHAGSRFYDVDGWRAGASSLRAPERELVGDVRGRSLLHLQCHFGLDTMSWERMGAVVTGVDFSGAAVTLARSLAAENGMKARFVECNVYDTRAHVKERFEIVFTSWGSIGWLPDLVPWAQVIAESLSPGGVFHLVEFHPYVWMSQVGPDLAIRYPYFNRGPITSVEIGTYADRSAPVELREHGWNHSIADIVGSLLGAGLQLRTLRELDHVPWDIFPACTRSDDGNFRFKDAPGMVPMTLALSAVNPG